MWQALSILVSDLPHVTRLGLVLAITVLLVSSRTLAMQRRHASMLDMDYHFQKEHWEILLNRATRSMLAIKWDMKMSSILI